MSSINQWISRRWYLFLLRTWLTIVNRFWLSLWLRNFKFIAVYLHLGKCKYIFFLIIICRFRFIIFIIVSLVYKACQVPWWLSFHLNWCIRLAIWMIHFDYWCYIVHHHWNLVIFWRLGCLYYLCLTGYGFDLLVLYIRLAHRPSNICNDFGFYRLELF